MPSTYATNSGIELIRNGEQSGTWGTTTNNNLNIVDRLTNGVGTIDLSSSGASHTLTTSDGALSDGQFKTLVLSGATQACTITIAPNDGQHIYFVVNGSGQTCTFSQGSGANVAVANGYNAIIYADGAGSGAAVVDITANLGMSSVNITGGSITGITDLAISDGGTGGSTDSAARTNLGVAIGSDVLAYDANLQGFVDALTLPTSDGSANRALTTNGSGTIGFSNLAPNTSIALSIILG